MAGPAADHLRGNHQIEQSTTAAWAGLIYSVLEMRDPGSLQNTEGG